MSDEIALALDELRRKLRRALVAGSKVEIEGLFVDAEKYPRCIDLALIRAIYDFFVKGRVSGLRCVEGVFRERDNYYTLGDMGKIKVAELRHVLGEREKIKGCDYIQFLFPLYFVRETFEKDGFFYSWIDSEWKKRVKNSQYNELYLLRNMVWSLSHGLVKSGTKREFPKMVEAMDEDIINILKRQVQAPSLPVGDDVKRIAICCGLLKHDKGSLHAKLVFDYANSLCLAYPHIEILVIVTNELPFRWVGESFRMSYVSLDYKKELLAELHRVVSPEVESRISLVFYPLANNGWQDILPPIRKVVELNPDVIMFFGSKYWNESWFARKLLFPYYPTAYFFSQMNNQVDPDIDVYLARNKYPLNGRYDKSRVRIAPPAIRDGLVLGSKILKKGGDSRSATRPGREGRVTLVTALIGPRMYQIIRKYRPEVRARMMELLDVDNVRWLWVGPSNADILYDLDPAFRTKHSEGKLEVIGFEQNLEGLYGQCDIMIHPPGFTGGGGGLLLALKSHLPVLCFGDTDMSTYVLPECVFEPGDISGFFDRAKELISKSGDLPSLGVRCSEYAATLDPITLAKATYEGLLDAVSFFRERSDKAKLSKA